MKINFMLCIQLSVLSNFGYSQTEMTDTTDLTLVSPKLFGGKCYEEPVHIANDKKCANANCGHDIGYHRPEAYDHIHLVVIHYCITQHSLYE